MILVIGVIRMSAQSLTSEVGIGSRSHDLVGDDFRILRMSITERITGLSKLVINPLNTAVVVS